MSLSRKVIWTVGIALAILVNLYVAAPRMYMGVQRPVDKDVVSVYSVNGGQDEKPLPVMAWDGAGPNDINGKYVDTGQRVRVYLRNDYRNAPVPSYSRYTLWILGSTILLHFVMGLRFFNRGQRRALPVEQTEQT